MYEKLTHEVDMAVVYLADGSICPSQQAAATVVNYWLHNRILRGQQKQASLDTILGVYALFLDAELIYIGQSVDVASRVTAHQHKSSCRDVGIKNFTHFAYIDNLDAEYLDIVERRMIRLCQPPANRKSISPSPFWGRGYLDDIAATLAVPVSDLFTMCRSQGVLEDHGTYDIKQTVTAFGKEKIKYSLKSAI